MEKASSYFSRRSIAVAAGLVVLVAVNMLLILNRKHGATHSVKDKARLLKRDSFHQQWQSEPASPILDPMFTRSFADVPKDDCLSPPTGATRLQVSDLPEAQETKLHQSITDMLACYSADKPDPIITLAERKHESIPKESLETLKSLLVKDAAIPRSTFAAKSDADIFRLFYNAAKFKSHWASVLLRSSCVCVYSMRDVTQADDIATLGGDDMAVWRNRVVFHRQFQPTRSLADELRDKGSVLFADVRIIIKHDVSQFQLTCPYYFRYWYDSSINDWHLLIINCMPTSEEFNARLIF